MWYRLNGVLHRWNVILVESILLINVIKRKLRSLLTKTNIQSISVVIKYLVSVHLNTSHYQEYQMSISDHIPMDVIIGFVIWYNGLVKWGPHK